MTKRLGFLLLMLLAVTSYGQKSGQPQPQQQTYHPLFADVSNAVAAQNDILSNTYQLLVKTPHSRTGAQNNPNAGAKGNKGETPMQSDLGRATAFRLHKNWFLTCAHGPFQQFNPHNSPMRPVGVSVRERSDAPGAAAPFSLVIDMTATGRNAKGKVYLLNPRLKLNSTNAGRGEDLALIYVPDDDPSQAAFAQANQDIQQMKEQLSSLGNNLSEEMLAEVRNDLSAAQTQASSVWKRFLNHPIKPFHLFILSEQTVIDELGYPGVTPYYFPLTAYYIHEPNKGVVKFTFKPQGTQRGTSAIFYERVTELIPGTSGSPMTYGNYVVSVDSATNCSPMLTDKFYNWLRRIMGKDYVQGMCVKPNPSTSTGTAVRRPYDFSQNFG